MHQHQEHDRVEQQVHGHDVGQRARVLEDVRLHERERDRQQRTPGLIAELPEERHEHRRLQQVGLPVEVPAQQGEDDADEEQLVPDADRADPDEQPRDQLGVSTTGQFMYTPDVMK